MSLRVLVFSVLLLLVPLAGNAADEQEEDGVPRQWQELDVQFPAPPAKGALIPLYVSAATDNRFYIDGSSLSVGADQVIRYVMVVETPGGARNVTYEGMRCESKSRRIYGSGRLDGTWSKARNSDWVRILDAYANRQHAALFLEYFCPFGNSVRTAAEARDALLRGGHPDVRR
ncbi:CNP1-like family protein [Dechloromonas sp. CZR5]|uniref:CNP1-like family protein n=1 Tax=Dechloromonas sp. CZR5 TaxID=2608630 RepID=UPI00123D6215|nr:CNP1-like family protein [Dechloromonas sp. CZR5]